MYDEFLMFEMKLMQEWIFR